MIVRCTIAATESIIPICDTIPLFASAQVCTFAVYTVLMKRNTLFTTTREAWRAMLADIEEAHESVYIEMYIFEQSPAPYDFVAVLCERAAAGVRVVLILDAYGSKDLPDEARYALIHAGVEVMFYAFVFNRTHRKLVVVDEHIAYVGGVNIGARFIDWSDLVVRLESRVVKSVVRSFARMYRVCGGTDARLLQHLAKTPLARAKTWFYEHGFHFNAGTLRRAYVRAIDGAQERLTIVTPYFVPQPWLMAALGRAAKRGVKVELLLPERTDVPFVHGVHRHYAGMLAQLAATIYLHPQMNHAKAMVVDERLAVVGSQNIDPLSFARNIEGGVWLERRSDIASVYSAINEWKTVSRTYQMDVDEPRWFDRFLAYVLRVVVRTIPRAPTHGVAD